MEDVYVGKNPDYKNPAIHYTAAQCSKIEKSAILNVCLGSCTITYLKD